MCDSKLHHLGVYMQKEKAKKESQDKKPCPKGDKEEVTILSQTTLIPSG